MEAKEIEYLHEMYNATSTEDKSGELESYENWLERQLLSRIEAVNKLIEIID